MKSINQCFMICVSLLLLTSAAFTQCSSSMQLLGSSGFINASPMPNSIYRIQNNVTITGNVVFSQCHILIEPNVTITVGANAILIIEASRLSSCSGMWNGIRVSPTGSISITSIPQSNFLTTKTTLIEDAKVAVDISNNTLTNNVLLCQNATFNRNQIGIRINNYTANITAYPFDVSGTVFTSRRISPSAPSLNWVYTNVVKQQAAGATSTDAPYINPISFSPANLKDAIVGIKPLYGISLNQVGNTVWNFPSAPVFKEFSIGKLSTKLVNVFDSHQEGIYAINSNIRVMNCAFQQSISTAVGNGRGIVSHCFDGLNYSTVVTSVNGAPLYGNVFYNCYNAIDSKNNLVNSISHNSVRCNLPFGNQTNFAGKIGVLAQTNRYYSFDVLENEFLSIAKPIDFQISNGNVTINNVLNFGIYAGQILIKNNTISKLFGSGTNLNWVEQGINVKLLGTPSILYPFSNGAIGTIESNNLTDVINGIALIKCPILTFINMNNIDMELDINTLFGIQIGILSKENTKSYVTRNEIFGFNKNMFDVWGVRSESCPNQVLTCNEISETYFGMAFFGNCLNSSITKNTFTSNRRGLGIDFGGDFGDQGLISTPSDNEWLGTWPVNPTNANQDFQTFVGSAIVGPNTSKLFVRNIAPIFNPDLSCFTSSSFHTFSIANQTIVISTPTSPPTIGCPLTLNPIDNFGYNNNDRLVSSLENNFVQRVYPNPSQGYFIVTVEADEETVFHVAITDVFGKQIHSEVQVSKNRELNIQLNASRGTYFATIENVFTGNKNTVQLLIE